MLKLFANSKERISLRIKYELLAVKKKVKNLNLRRKNYLMIVLK